MSDRNKKILLSAGTVISLGLGFLVGWLVHPAPAPGDPSQSVGEIGDSIILPTTAVTWEYRFTMCEHVRTVKNNRNVIGMSKDELTAKFSGSEILQWDQEQVSIKRTIEGCCPAHYLLQLNDRQIICVYQVDSNTFEKVLYMELTTDSGSIDAEAMQELKTGVCLNTLDEINEYIESVES